MHKLFQVVHICALCQLSPGEQDDHRWHCQPYPQGDSSRDEGSNRAPSRRLQGALRSQWQNLLAQLASQAKQGKR